MINTRGEFVIPCRYSFIANGFDDRYVVVRLNGKYGMVRKETGEVVVPVIYEEIGWPWAFKEGVISVKKMGKWGVLTIIIKLLSHLFMMRLMNFQKGSQ